MKKITILFLLIFTSSIYSQTLEMPNIPSEGITYEVVVKNSQPSNSSWNTSTTGPWDFSNESLDLSTVIQIAPVSDSQFSSDYPNASHVKYEDGYEFFLGFEVDAYTFHGERSVINTSYSSPITINPYPFSLGDAVYADNVVDEEFTCSVCPPYMERDDSSQTEVLGGGTLTTPDGTVYENLTLVRADRLFNDGQVGSSTCNTTIEALQWWADDIAIPVAQVVIQQSTGACDATYSVVSKFLGTGDTQISCPDEYELPIVWRENFECLTPFAIDNIEGWVAIDGEGGQTWGANDVDFTNENYVGSGIVWNQIGAVPANAGGNIGGYAPYEGNQGLYFFASGANSTPFPNDDWMIGPEFTISGVTSPTLSFWAKSITDAYGLDRFQIGIGSSTNPDDFTIISSGNYVEAPTEWTQYEYDLSAYEGQTVRVGIHCVSNDSFVLQMDAFVVEGTLGVNYANDLEMNLYPNPVDGGFVTIQTPTSDTKQVEVYDILGKLVISTNLVSDTLNVSELNSGIYMVKVTVKSQSNMSKLIIK